MDSLSLNDREQLKAVQAAENPAFKFRDNRAIERDWWWSLLALALAHPKGSRERRAAIDAIRARPLTDWDGQPYRPSRRTIERKLAAYESHGVAGLAGKVRSDKGTSRVVISDRWDAAVSLDHVERHRIAVELRSYIRGLYKADTAFAVLAQLAAGKLNELTVAACGEPALDLPPETFHIPRRIIAGERRFRNVAIFNKDRKAFEDAKPRILRTREGLEPMALVVGDVHHLDIVMRRPDGTEAWPKAIAWLDLATNRVWLDLVLLGKGEGIRNADVIASFIRMVAAWGLPQALYLDNGSEYRWSDFIDDALKLVARVDGGGDDRCSQIVRAKPYNAPAKAIEGLFGILEQRYFRTLPGWAGGDRTNKKTANVGKPPEPFPGTIDDLRVAIGSCLTLYEMSPQRGTLKGRSPRQVYEAALAAGWQRVAVDQRQLHTVFATDEIRTPRQGYINFGGDKWTCPELQAFLGNRIIVRVPKFHQPEVLPLLDPAARQIIGFATPATRYGVLDPAGARAAATMDKRRRTAVRELDQMAPDVDTNAEVARLAATVAALPPAPVVATIGISGEAAEIARGLAEPEIAREHRRVKERERHMQRRLAAYAKSKPGAGHGL
jgi:hypothetical protein